MQVDNLEFDQYDWWISHKKDFPNLYRLFLNTSCTPAASTSAERVFSTTGNIVSEKRSRLQPEVVNDIMVLRNKID